MGSLLFIFLIATYSFFKSISDTLEHHFSTSLFARWTGNKWIDPSISWEEKYNYGWFQRLLRGTFSDLWHVSESAKLITLFFVIYIGLSTDIPWYYFFPLCFGIHWIVFEFFYGFWQMLASKKNN